MSYSLNSTSFTPTIDFTEIPPAGELLVPGVRIEVAADYTNIGLLPFPTRAFAIGQMIAAGNATPGTIYTITQKGQGAALFGAGSPLAEQIAYFQASNPGVPLDAVGLELTGENAAAAGSITFGGAANFNGTQAVGVAGFRIAFSIAPTDTPADMATNFIAAAGAIYNAQNLPVEFATNGTPGQVALTAIYEGVAGNELDVRANPARGDNTVPGVTVAIVKVGTGTPGTGIASIAAVISAIATTWYTDIIIGLNDETTLGVLDAALASRYTAMENVDSTAYVAWRGTQGQLVTQATGINCQWLVAIGVTNPQDPTWRWSAALGGVAARAFTDDPARQLRGLALPNIILPAPVDLMYEPEQEALLEAGVATWEAAPDGTVIIQRAISTYTESALGVPDGAWRDIMIAKVMTRIRWDWKNYLLLVAPNAKLAPDGSVASLYDPTIMTPRVLHGLWAARSALYEQAGWIENAAANAQAAIFEIDPNDKNRVNSQRPLTIIGNYMLSAERLLFAA